MENRFSVKQVREGQRRRSGASMANLPENGVLETSLDMPHMTREAPPRLEYYRNATSVQAASRPTLGQLHEGVEEAQEEPPKATSGGGHHIKLGWIQGVLIPVLLNIWGVMLFLRLSWVVAEAGVAMSLVIIGISAAVCVVTTLSLSAISTNGEVKGGGIYYMISRSLGPEFGASVGIVFAFANAVAASMNTIGFCNSLNDLLQNNGIKIIDGANNDVRLVGMIALLLMIIICAVGMDWEVMAQNFLVVIIAGAIVDFVTGTALGPGDSIQRQVQGFPGFSFELLQKNMGTDYRFKEGVNHDFFSVFSIYFPSVTGIQAGANISGDLKDPASAIPKGTLLALAISMFSYVLFAILAGGGALRDASGNVAEFLNGTYTNCTDRVCEYGLHNSYSVMQLMSIWGPWIYAGCFAATLSTALTNLLSVPRLIQALGVDQIYPGIIFFSKGYGSKGEPYRGYVLTFIVSGAFLLIAELNVIAPLISNFYLASYALINLCTFHAAFIKPIGWRPTFRYYNKWLSLIGFISCVAIMFLISWITSLITMVTILLLYLIVVYRKPDVNWGSSTEAQTYKTTLGAVYSLNQTNEHVKNYRPQLLVLSSNPASRPALIDFANLITKNLSLLILGRISRRELSYNERSQCLGQGNRWLKDHKIRGFFHFVDGFSFQQGTKALIQASGIGKLKPNVLLMGYKNEWSKVSRSELNEYFDVLHDAFNNRMAVSILRVKGGLDFSTYTEKQEPEALSHSVAPTLTRVDSDRFINYVGIEAYTPPDSPDIPKRYTINGPRAVERTPQEILRKKKKTETNQSLYSGPDGQTLPHDIVEHLSVFQCHDKKGTVDVWWLYDDGGLTLLLPYILTTRAQWSGCRLRIYALVNQKEQLELEERNMASLLSKFRIDYSSLTMIHNIDDPPHQETVSFFEHILKPFREGPGLNVEDSVSASELAALQYKTNRQLRLRELLLAHSNKANFVVMTMPMPRKSVISAPLYMAWLELLTKDMPPFLLVRGNQTSVLTFYS